MITLAEVLAGIILSRDEERAFAKLESTIDLALRAKFDGGPVAFPFSEVISRRVAWALCRKYEEMGCWRAVAKLDATASIFSFVPVYGASAVQPRLERGALPPITIAQAVCSNTSDSILLVRMPTRGRPKQALEVLEKYRTMAGCPIAIEVVIDDDDESMLSCEVQQRLLALGCVVTVDRHGSKIAACNGGRVTSWDVILLASDDMVPIANGYAIRVLNAMREHFPHFDGAIYFSDGYQGEHCCTLPIFGYRLYDQFGYIYESAYKSLFCDLEQTEVLRATGRLAYVDEKLIEHRHHVTGKSAKDALYEKNDALWPEDQAVYEARKCVVREHAQNGFDSPPLWLSICVASLPVRRAQLDLLLDQIYTQILEREEPREVEVLVDSREGLSIGEKRQELLERARGHFVAFVDDDDGVSHDYIERVVSALKSEPNTDCASLSGTMTTAGAVPEPFNISLANAEDCTRDGAHYRTTNHLTAVRREIALQAGFKAMSYGEDFDYARRLRTLLTKEVSTGVRPIYMYWYMPTKEQGVR